MNKQEIEKAIEVIKKFKHFADLVESPDEYFQHMQGHTKELSLVLNVFDVADLCDDIVKLLNHQLTNGWIPVSERLPEEYKYVSGNDCCFISGNVLCSAYNNETQQDEIWVDYTCDGEWQTHEYYEGEKLAWMPLPGPYKEVSE